MPFSTARANLSELAEQVKAGAEKIITKNGESYIALIDAQKLDYYHRLERARIHLLLIDEAGKGLADVETGRVTDARSAFKAQKTPRCHCLKAEQWQAANPSALNLPPTLNPTLLKSILVFKPIPPRL